MTEVMISVHPEWCEMILQKQKTLEIRKSSPKSLFPFRVYLYATVSRPTWFRHEPTGPVELSGMVIGDFICDEVVRFDVPYPAYRRSLPAWITDQSCVGYYQLHRYALASNDCKLHAWRISDFRAYEKPLDIGHFLNSKGKVMTRPPQSWCYCEKRDL